MSCNENIVPNVRIVSLALCCFPFGAKAVTLFGVELCRCLCGVGCLVVCNWLQKVSLRLNESSSDETNEAMPLFEDAGPEVSCGNDSSTKSAGLKIFTGSSRIDSIFL